ncbi:PIN domain-containing protein [Rhizobium sp. HT1-10]|uniref:PIN domain-containing protein n=1 Tax=Rhizobium sp. HT1-10 TaxID=3111638 RepID=UPI003C1A7593
MTYLIDTNIISNVMRQPTGKAADRMRVFQSGQLSTSVLVQAEVRFGYTKSGVLRQKIAAEAILQHLRVEDWSTPADLAYAALRSELEKAGIGMGQIDMLIAAHALVLDAVVVTDDRAFSRVPGLKVENWLL